MANNGLLPAMDFEDFQTTDAYDILLENPDLLAACLSYLEAAGEEAMEFCPNPGYYYAPYEQEVFDECCDYLRFVGERQRKFLLLDHVFEFYRTNVGKYIVFRSSRGKVWGFLQRR